MIFTSALCIALCSVCWMHNEIKRHKSQKKDRDKNRERERERERETSICLSLKRWYHKPVQSSIFFIAKAHFAVVIFYRTMGTRTETHADRKRIKNCRWTVTVGGMRKDTSQRKTETVSAAPHSHEAHNSAESKTTEWNRKSVFLGIHLHSNYSNILGRVCSTGLIQCTAAKRTLGHLSGLWHERPNY